jgi:hypothetical protein
MEALGGAAKALSSGDGEHAVAERFDAAEARLAAFGALPTHDGRPWPEFTDQTTCGLIPSLHR